MRVRCATRKSWALISLPLVLASCNKHRPADEFHSAHGAMVTGYCSSSATEAEKALLDYRQIAVATKGDKQIGNLCDRVLTVPDAPPILQPFLTVLPLQLMSYAIALAKGNDVDQPRNLAKSVTVE